jgi:hypothetical protein
MALSLSRSEWQKRTALLYMENRSWPSTMTAIAQEQWPSAIQDASRVAVFRSSSFLAQLFRPLDGGQRLSINRTEITREGDWRADISWEELMRVKAECGFADCWAVEVFPPKLHVVNVANMRHLWLLPSAPAFAWRKTEAR